MHGFTTTLMKSSSWAVSKKSKNSESDHALSDIISRLEVKNTDFLSSANPTGYYESSIISEKEKHGRNIEIGELKVI